jgi:hypothetical protein
MRTGMTFRFANLKVIILADLGSKDDIYFAMIVLVEFSLNLHIHY